MHACRIAVVGISASGKSYAGRRVAELTGLPLFHIDNLLWKGKWEAIPAAEYLAKHQELIRNDRWVIEGYVDEATADRFKRADLVLYLDYSGMRCFFRVLKRWWMYRRVSRPELPDEAVDDFDPGYFWRVLIRQERLSVESALVKAGDISSVVRFKSPKEFEEYSLKMGN